MGQKTHPVGFRLGFTKTWNAKWFANRKNYPVLLKEDIGIRNAIRGRLRDAAIARIDIERCTVCFSTLRNETRRSSCCATFSAMRYASSSG